MYLNDIRVLALNSITYPWLNSEEMLIYGNSQSLMYYKSQEIETYESHTRNSSPALLNYIILFYCIWSGLRGFIYRRCGVITAPKRKKLNFLKLTLLRN